MRHILITGAAGYIGSHLVKAALAQEFKVSILLRKSTDISALRPFMNRLSVWYDDGGVESLAEFMQEQNVECVVHLATHYLTYHKPTDIEHMLESNIGFGVRILEAMKLAGVKNIIYTRTSWQHYQDCEYNPVNLYASMKQAFEDIMKYYTQAEDVHSLTLEIYDTYGEHDPRSKIINLFKQQCRTGGVIKLSPGEQKLDFLYIDDIIAAFFCAFRSMECSQNREENYALCSREVYTLKEVVDIFEATYHTKLNIEWGAFTYRPREIFKPYRLLEPLEGWQPVYNLESGFRRMYEKDREDTGCR